MESLATLLTARIQDAYADGKYGGVGWRLLSSPASVLDRSEMAFIGLNPGGDRDVVEHGQLTPIAGSAYVTESWKGLPVGAHPLQRQVVQLFDRLNFAPETVLAGNLVPFRSPSWKVLPNRAEAITFGVKMWCEIFKKHRPRLIVTMSRLEHVAAKWNHLAWHTCG